MALLEAMRCSECRTHFGAKHTFSRRNGRMKDTASILVKGRMVLPLICDTEDRKNLVLRVKATLILLDVDCCNFYDYCFLMFGMIGSWSLQSEIFFRGQEGVVYIMAESS